MISIDTVIEDAKRRTEVLLQLLEDPYPGLGTWSDATLETLKELAEVFGYDLSPIKK